MSMSDEELSDIEERFKRANWTEMRTMDGGWPLPSEALCSVIEDDIPRVFREARRLREFAQWAFIAADVDAPHGSEVEGFLEALQMKAAELGARSEVDPLTLEPWEDA